MSALVDFSIAEAEALLKRTAPDGACSMTAAECDAADSARTRLAQAVAVERGAGGKDTQQTADLDTAEGQGRR